MNTNTIRQRDHLESKDARAYLEKTYDQVLAHRGIDHPFLNQFANHAMDNANLRKVFLEFYYFIHHLPFYIAGMAMSTRDEKILREIAVNVAEEVGERDQTPHLDIYRDFLDRLGISPQEMHDYEPLASTRAIDQGVKDLYTESPIETSLGAIFALETMSSRMVSLLNDGLRQSGYDEETRFFFELHIEAEQGHSNGVYNAASKYLVDAAGKQRFEAGVNGFMNLIEGFWTGVASIVTFKTGGGV